MRIETVQGMEWAAGTRPGRSCRGSVFEIKERAGANPRGLATSTNAEIGHDARQELVAFMNSSG
jgi:hypothetical protein